MQGKQPVMTDRIRNIRKCTFGWVDHDFLHQGFLNLLSQHELLLYYFFITVADRNGVSFYDYERICQFLKLEVDDYIQARNQLCKRSLIAAENGVFQVLSLPRLEYKKLTEKDITITRSAQDAQALKDILAHIM